ncbi:putative NHN endonuclease [Salmonella phage SETP3]|uniref:NHN endonuclease n=2 Tax=Jerseyvirus TaxID=1910991 RepID=A0A1B1PDT8_9CAUD|nr:HNH endonuclease [Salmonella phage SETP3]YP_009322847.1 HNH endonuclease [Salmonella phage BPS11Q3]ABN47338.2 putative NHN endonuclease [Salmonella phage SETP3]ANT42331.1 NHN endonuclease [Salmonella phage BPS11Q3]AUM59073.1 NHN endonuclease [Salmonella phage BPS11T2]
MKAPSADIKDFLSYDPDTGIFKWVKHRCQTAKPGDVVTYKDRKGYILLGWNRVYYRAHRLAWWWVYGVMPTEQIDHINGIRDDNRICNLRLADEFQQNHNRKTPVTNTSGVKGVNWSKHHSAWCARVTFKGTRYQIGYFQNINDAEVSLREFREKLHGEFCNHGD